MKSSLKILATLFIVSLMLNSCKKGEEDPWISIHSRDARITGTWKLVEWNGKSEVFQDNAWSREDYAFSNGDLKIYSSGTKPIWTLGTGTMSYTITIEKGGVVSQEFETSVESLQTSGYWRWVNNNKKKSMLETEEFALNLISNRKVFEIKKLSNKEMILVFSLNENYNTDGTQYDLEQKFSHTYTFEKTKDKSK